MPLELNITPEDVDALVRDTLMRSAFGKTITDAVEKALKGDGYRSPLGDAVSQHIAQVAKELLHEKYGEQVKALVADAIEKRITKEVLESITVAAIDKMKRAAEDRY